MHVHLHDLISICCLVTEKLWVEVPHSICSWTVVNAVKSDTFTLSHLIEVLVTCCMSINVEALSMLPGMSYLHVAQPGVSIESTLLIWLVQVVNIVPAQVMVHLGLDADVTKISELGGVVGLQQMSTIDRDKLSLEKVS